MLNVFRKTILSFSVLLGLIILFFVEQMKFTGRTFILFIKLKLFQFVLVLFDK